MLPKMSRQILHRDTQLEIFAKPRMLQIEPCITKSMIEGIVLIAVFPGRNCSRNFIERLGIESQSFAHLPPRHSAAISNDVGRHGRTALAITLVQILNDAFALIATRQIEIDIGPLAALFR